MTLIDCNSESSIYKLHFSLFFLLLPLLKRYLLNTFLLDLYVNVLILFFFFDCSCSYLILLYKRTRTIIKFSVSLPRVCMCQYMAHPQKYFAHFLTNCFALLCLATFVSWPWFPPYQNLLV